MTAILIAEHLRYHAGEAALISDVSLSLTTGEVLAVVGPNGAGKSTLLRLLAGDLTPRAGHILLEGRMLRSYSPLELARRRAVMTQHAIIQFAFQVEQVVVMGRYPHRDRRDISPHEDQQIVESALLRTEMAPLRTRAYPTLSGGEAARTLLARTLAQETRLMLLDEPTASLDIRHQELVMGIVRELAANGKAVLMVLHDLNLAAAYADRLALLHRGRLVAMGSPQETLTAPLLSEIYGYPVYVTTHPRRNCPLVLADNPRE
jgi:iron complex transport system ATP-binding protein